MADNSSKMIRQQGFKQGEHRATLKNLPEAWQRWKLLQASDEGGGEDELVVDAGPANGERWKEKAGSPSTFALRSSHSKSREWYSASSLPVLSGSTTVSMASALCSVAESLLLKSSHTKIYYLRRFLAETKVRRRRPGVGTS